jgi:hypothetical protein
LLQQVEVSARSKVAAEIRPHISHCHEIIVVTEQESKLEIFCVLLLEKISRQHGLGQGWGAAKIVIVFRFLRWTHAEGPRN